MAYKMSVELFLPAFDSFILGASQLGSTEDMLGPPNYNVGRWVTVTCDTGDIKINQGYANPNPLGMYQTGVAELTLTGIHWSPSINPDVLPGVKIQISAIQTPRYGIYGSPYQGQFVTQGLPNDVFPIFTGYILDIDEDWGSAGTRVPTGYPKTITITAVDEWHKIVKGLGDQQGDLVDFAQLPNLLSAYGVGAHATQGLISARISQIKNNLEDFERAVLSVAGSAYVKNDLVYVNDYSIWEDMPATHFIQDRHYGPHLCYTAFDKRQRLTNVMNTIVNTNVTLSGTELIPTTTTFTDPASTVYYGNSGHRVTTALQDFPWPGDTYITAGRYPEVRTRSVDVELRPDNIKQLPHIQDSVNFEYQGVVEKRRVSGRNLHFTPTKWEGTIQFFDFILFEVSESPTSLPRVVSPRAANPKQEKELIAA